ncbi:MAG TPA: 4'-phosphopantetheinyl transferase superfamily protein [Vicinamibacterales bacterium]|nr:4'-phosphopantetheinyl transferase superfamily protein [Vicinamibacterales bacterium]
MNTRWWIGNDIVDLAEPGVAGKERDRRFMDRVFTPAERAHILDAAAPTIALWKTWAAKETAFKIAGKLREKVVFAHQAFEVHAESAGERARVRFENLDIRVRWETALDYIHCIGQAAREGAPGGGPGRLKGGEGAIDWRGLFARIVQEGQSLDGVLSRAEQASVHSSASERARLLARRLLDRWDLQGAEIVRLWRSWGWSPPVVAREGTPLAAFDVSLSHDGRFVAAAVVGPA